MTEDEILEWASVYGIVMLIIAALIVLSTRDSLDGD